METLPDYTDKKSRFELKTLLETSRLLIESRETDFVLNNLLLITMGKMLVPRGAILIHDEQDSGYIVRKIKGRGLVNEGDRIELPWEPDQFESVVLDPAREKIDPPELFEGKNRGLFFNLRTSNHHLGYLYMSRKGGGEVLNEHEIEFVESLSIISSVAIANSRMFAEMREVNRKLDRKVYELNTLLSLSRDFSMMVDREKIASTFKFALLGQLLIRKFFLLYHIDGKIDLMASSGLSRAPNKGERKQIFDIPDDIKIVDPDDSNTTDWLKENDIAALIALQMQGEKIAVVGVSSKANRDQLSQSDFNFLQSLGNLAVLSIQKTQFLEERIERERLEEEINIAKSIQQGLFPDPVPEIPTWELSAKNIPSQQVGGDYYDIAETPDKNFIVAIGDVTGKGIPASLLMANLQSMLHVLLPVDISLGRATDQINNLIYQNTPSDKFITFFWGKYFHQEKRLSYINAGHNPPLLLRKESDSFEELSEGGLILGAMPTQMPYEVTDVELHSGDLMVLYTDGVNESMSRSGEEYGEKRLKELILNRRGDSAEQILDAIIEDVRAFSRNRFSDDLTLIVIKMK